MISICLKSIHTSHIDTLENSLSTCELPGIYYLQKQICGLANLIIHYKGHEIDSFNFFLSEMFTKYIIDTYEIQFIRNALRYDYFYFSPTERNEMLEQTKKELNRAINVEEKKFTIKKAINEYFSENKKCNIEGFVTFRLTNYKQLINNIIDTVTCEYVVQKEYMEYVNLLQSYILAENSQSETIHLIYNKNNKVLLDDKYNILTNVSNSQVYLSDISFSSNDFILHSLLTLLPKQLIIHIDDSPDEFINFLSSIFCNKVSICNNCKICLPFLNNNSAKGLNVTT